MRHYDSKTPGRGSVMQGQKKIINSAVCDVKPRDVRAALTVTRSTEYSCNSSKDANISMSSLGYLQQQ